MPVFIFIVVFAVACMTAFFLTKEKKPPKETEEELKVTKTPTEATSNLIITIKRNSDPNLKSEISQEEGQLWSCPYCETLNPKENRVCQACGQKR